MLMLMQIASPLFFALKDVLFVTWETGLVLVGKIRFGRSQCTQLLSNRALRTKLDKALTRRSGYTRNDIKSSRSPQEPRSMTPMNAPSAKPFAIFKFLIFNRAREANRASDKADDDDDDARRRSTTTCKQASEWALGDKNNGGGREKREIDNRAPRRWMLLLAFSKSLATYSAFLFSCPRKSFYHPPLTCIRGTACRAIRRLLLFISWGNLRLVFTDVCDTHPSRGSDVKRMKNQSCFVPFFYCNSAFKFLNTESTKITFPAGCATSISTDRINKRPGW